MFLVKVSSGMPYPENLEHLGCAGIKADGKSGNVCLMLAINQVVIIDADILQ